MYLDPFIRRANEAIFRYEEPLRYLYQRGLTEEDIRKFSLGYLSIANIADDGSEEYKRLKDQTYGFKALEKKILIPVKNILGKVNGVITRDLKEKKYRQFFLKEAKNIGTFFGLYEALPYITKQRKVFVHEGAIDSISFGKVFPNSISVLTSRINECQYETLRFFADTIILVFDEDSPGKHGVKTMYEIFGKKHLYTLSIGFNDSNACLQRMGLDAFKTYMRNKVPLLLRN
jgi:DNA primase